MPKIKVLISPEGDVTVKPIGFRGPKCLRATAKLEKALGGIVERETTPEMVLRDGGSAPSRDVDVES